MNCSVAVVIWSSQALCTWSSSRWFQGSEEIYTSITSFCPNVNSNSERSWNQKGISGVRILRSSDSGVFCLLVLLLFFLLHVGEMALGFPGVSDSKESTCDARFRIERSKTDTLLFHKLHDFKASRLDFLKLHFLMEDNMYYIGKLKIQ